MRRFSFLLWLFGVVVWSQGVVNDCKKAHDNALTSIQYVGSTGFPRYSKTTSNCKYTISVNYGVYIKLSADVLDIPCVGANGIYIEEKGGRAGPFCAKKKMPPFVSRDVFFDIHIVIDTPLNPGWRVKIGYKQVKSSEGRNLPPSRGKRPPAIMHSMDQDQGILQQTNAQNMLLESSNQNSQGQIFVDQEATPQEFDQKQPQNMRNMPKNPVGGGGFGGPKMKSAAGGGGRKPKKTWESKTWNGNGVNEEPVFKTLGKPRLGPEPPKESGGGGIIMAVILLILLICVAIFLVHKRQQMINEEMKKQESETLKDNEARKAEAAEAAFKPVQLLPADDKSAEPAAEAVADCVETAKEKTKTIGKTVSKDSGVEASAAPKRTTSEDSNASAKSKESQATTAPSISEYPKPPERKKRTGVRK